jgi:glycosyltransferase involved in cell wall biosynthesis
VPQLAPLGIEHRPRADVGAELGELDVFVMPSRSDPFPLVVLEAMAAGLPVVGARVDGIAEQISAEAGMLVPPEDPPALAAAMLDLHRDPERRRRLGEGGWRRVVEHFPLRRQVEGLDAAYRSALGR